MYIRCKHVAALINKLYCCFEKRSKSYVPFNRLIKFIKKKENYYFLILKNAIKIGHLSEVMEYILPEKKITIFSLLYL